VIPYRLYLEVNVDDLCLILKLT